MKLSRFILPLAIVALCCTAEAENVTIESGGLYYSLDPLGNFRKATLIAPTDGSVYTGDVKVPNNLTYNNKEYSVGNILKTAFTNSTITSLVLPSSYSFVDVPEEDPGGLASSGSSLTGGHTSSLVPDSKIEEMRELYHKIFDSCTKLKEIYVWADSKGTATAGDGHVYFDNIHKPYDDNWIGSKLYRWHIYTPRATAPAVKFTQATTEAREDHFIFSTGNFTNYTEVESIEFPNHLRLDEKYFFTTDEDVNCPKLVKYGLGGLSDDVDCLFSGSDLFAIPPGLTGNLNLSSYVNICGNFVLKHSNITGLTFTNEYYFGFNDLSGLYEGYDGNITLQRCLDNQEAETYFASFATVKPGHTLYCDPYNAEVAKKYWPGKVEANDFYIKSIVTGLGSMVIEFGGSPEKIGSITGISQKYEYSDFNHKRHYERFGVSKKISDNKWVLNRIPTGFARPQLELKGLTVLSEHPMLNESAATREQLIAKISGTVTDIKQHTAKIKIDVPGVSEYDDDFLSDMANHLGSSIKVESLTRTSINFSCLNLTPGQNFGWAVPAKSFKIILNEAGNVTSSLESTYNLAEDFKTNKTPELKITEFEYEASQCGFKITKLKANFDDSWAKEDTEAYYAKYNDINAQIGQQAYTWPSFGIDLNGKPVVPDITLAIYTGTKQGQTRVYLGTRVIRMQTLFMPLTITPTTIELRPRKGDAKILSQKIYYAGKGITAQNGTYPSIEGTTLTSMPQGTVYFSAEISIERPDGQKGTFKMGTQPTDGKGVKIVMPKIEMETKPVKVVNAGSAIVAAQTNISDRETNFGFQWKKYDAPESLNPSEAYCGLYDGIAEGYIKNLSTSNYYNVRAFYRDKAGNCTYGAWVTFDPSDFSFFEPTAHTYATTEVTHRTASIRGYILRGSDDIIDQGFEYGLTSGSSATGVMKAPVAGASNTVSINGQVIEHTLTDLEPDTEYFFRTYVTTKEGTYYGETQTFRTDKYAAGVNDITADSERTLIGVYNLTGLPVSDTYRGFCIEVYSDGTTRKVLRK